MYFSGMLFLHAHEVTGAHWWDHFLSVLCADDDIDGLLTSQMSKNK